MANGIPEEPPWDPGFMAASMGGFDIDVDDRALDEFIADAVTFDSAWEGQVAMIIPGITRELREGAQRRSPYLYGILHGAHLDETFGSGDEMEGAVHIDPNVWHPVLGGRPVDYGSRIHREGRPWFAWTVMDDADRIVTKYGAELLDIVGEHFNSQRAGWTVNYGLL